MTELASFKGGEDPAPGVVGAALVLLEVLTTYGLLNIPLAKSSASKIARRLDQKHLTLRQVTILAYLFLHSIEVIAHSRLGASHIILLQQTNQVDGHALHFGECHSQILHACVAFLITK